MLDENEASELTLENLTRLVHQLALQNGLSVPQALREHSERASLASASTAGARRSRAAQE